MRGTVDGLATPHPIGGLLPAFLQEDDFTVRLTTAFDAVLAPVFSVFDCLEAYVDPLLAPDDFVPWLATWVGTATVDGSVGRRTRENILASTPMHRLRGTAAGLQAQLELATAGEVEIVETGEFQVSTSPTQDEDEPDPAILIRIKVDTVDSVRMRLVEDLIDRMKPAHVPHAVEVVTR